MYLVPKAFYSDAQNLMSINLIMVNEIAHTGVNTILKLHFITNLFVSRARLMECLLPDERVRICRVPHSRESPMQTPLRGHTSETRTFNPVKDLKQDCSSSVPLTPCQRMARRVRCENTVSDRQVVTLQGVTVSLPYFPPDYKALLGEAMWSGDGIVGVCVVSDHAKDHVRFLYNSRVLGYLS